MQLTPAAVVVPHKSRDVPDDLENLVSAQAPGLEYRRARRVRLASPQTLEGPMTDTLQGGCACGKLRYRMRTEPMFVHCCHCKDCQRQTGTAFVLNALIETDRIELLSGDPRPYAMPTDSGRPHRVFRCPECGSAVWSEYGGLGSLRFVRVGTLDQPQAVPPDVHIYVRSKLPWITLPDGVPAYEAYYDSRTLWPPASLERRKAALG
jgi:hypothetical protein